MIGSALKGKYPTHRLPSPAIDPRSALAEVQFVSGRGERRFNSVTRRRSLEGLYGKCGSGFDSPLFGYIAGKRPVKFRFLEAAGRRYAVAFASVLFSRVWALTIVMEVKVTKNLGIG